MPQQKLAQRTYIASKPAWQTNEIDVQRARFLRLEGIRSVSDPQVIVKISVREIIAVSRNVARMYVCYGRRRCLFPEGSAFALRLVDSRSARTGVVIATYRPNGHSSLLHSNFLVGVELGRVDLAHRLNPTCCGAI